ncbi:MAG: dihydrofolate reductase [Sphingomonas sp.]|uniref:dihydrofolate reductase family protein n=1 Tax=Sphingomonas sp. TaxID=28214 RepID=UPI001201626D|nr:dihydrofolate reductase family protein [Sphingomonas sp.]THD37345.1 MAG: dihydrofolate reductase [Sphingomonas sp.]
MRKITGAVFLSLDGVMQAPGGPTEDYTGGFDEGGWLFRFADEGAFPTIGALFSGEYDLLLGRRTYDIFASYWPYVEGDGAEMGAAFTRAGKHVLTHGDQPLDWENSHRLTSVADVAELKQSDGPDLIIQGSSTLYPELLAAGLIDTLILMIFPVTIGKGKRLFGDGTPAGVLRMVEHRVTPKGTVIATYEPAGAIPSSGDFPETVTSAREQDRQRRMTDGSW